MGLADVCRPRSRLDCELLCNIYIFKVILVYWHQEIGHHSLWSGPCFLDQVSYNVTCNKS
ncbi:hypothetical protein BDR07DRAFT_1391210 [Suillus spraguei]|nr:hypothetical protein BDR07DRAFT_1438029 [Suillus spraguei]KAG2368363.1 hypothetical protein BDR07DRAFT_1391210 [Suillus spraguei]